MLDIYPVHIMDFRKTSSSSSRLGTPLIYHSRFIWSWCNSRDLDDDDQDDRHVVPAPRVIRQHVRVMQVADAVIIHPEAAFPASVLMRLMVTGELIDVPAPRTALESIRCCVVIVTVCFSLNAFPPFLYSMS